MRYFLTLLLIASFSFSGFSQSLEEELGYIYVKAEYLIETNRYDEAISELTKVIAKDPSYKDALYLRAESKFNVAAYQGTMNDLTESFRIKGISPHSVLLYGKTQKNLGMNEAARQTMETAELLYPNGTTARNKTDNQQSQNKPKTEDEGKLKDEVKKIEEKISSILADLLPDNEGTEEEGSETQRDDRGSRDDDGRTTRNDDDRSTTRNEYPDRNQSPDPEPEPEVIEVDNSVRDIYIDEDVTLEIKNGLGARKILQQPNILILSETSGVVVVDLCVNENGKVTQAEYNTSESTLKTQSIISLAVRKAKEFWFEKSSNNESCGTLVYKITGSK